MVEVVVMTDIEYLLRTDTNIEVADARTRMHRPRSRVKRTLKLLDSSSCKAARLLSKREENDIFSILNGCR
ncbi:hypothetical protein Plhal304r1_c051g0134161 [Plasmopara halstedii]